MKTMNLKFNVILGIFTLTLFGVASAAEPNGQAKTERRNPSLTYLPVDTWVHVKTARNPVGRSYSGIGGAIGGGYIFYFGGGHGSHPGNDVELYDIARNTWIRATEPENWQDAGKWTHLNPEEKKQVKGIGGGWGVGFISPKGRPMVEHTYQYTCYDPAGKQFISVLSSGTWSFDPIKRKWKPLAGKYSPDKRSTPPRCATAAHLVLYDPGVKQVVLFSGRRDYAIHMFDLKKNTWQRKAANRIVYGVEAYGTFVANKKSHLILQTEPYAKHPGLHWFDASTLKLKKGPAMPQGMLKYNTSMTYDPDNKEVVFLQRRQKRKGVPLVWAYSPKKDSWRKVSMKGQPPAGFTAWNQLVYDRQHKCFLFLNVLSAGGGGVGGKTDGLYAFRLSRPTTTGK